MILQTLKDAWAAVSIRKKIIFTLLMLLVFRIGTHIPIPYIDTEYLVGQIGSGGIMDFFNTFSGGSLKRFSVFTLSIMPYITASIIMQLLTVVIPHLERLQKEGEQGRKKIAQYIRYATVVFGFVNGFGITMGFRAAIVVPAGAPDWAVYLLITLVLTAGTAFLMWLGEQITEKGIGNGISLIIFAGIVAGVPDGIKEMLRLYMARSISILMVIAVAVVAIAMVVAVVFIQQGQRKIPVQYTKRVVGRKVYGGQSTHIPLKVNQA
ncbi:MAG: preprotein translocase subunit SecY, partial [Gracilibacteraceae bacterium]|nr:preprotein translocase subunit SecY [Gracilibacteraceae bacterium]